MLVSYSLQNFKSYKEKKHFELICSNSKAKKRYLENFTRCADIDIFKTAIIVGENAGGKSNFIQSLDFIKRHLFSLTDKKATSYRNICFYAPNNCTDSYIEEHLDITKQEFDIEVFINNKFYNYFVSLDAYGICEERLGTKNRYVDSYKTIFSFKREMKEANDPNKISFKYTVKVKKELNINVDYLKENKNNGLFINAFSLLGSEDAQAFVNWIKNDLFVIYQRIPLDLYYIIYNSKYDDQMIKILESKEFLEIFKLVDSSIIGLEVDHEKPFEDSLVIRNTTKCENKHKISSDSSGVLQFFALSYEIYKVIYQNMVIFADEFDSFLNPLLTSKIINYINSFDTNGQFIFTTHNVTQLNFQTFMKEQMYIVTKDKKELTSDMYPVSVFKDLRYDSNQKIYEFYFKGLLGGVDNE